MPTEVTGLWKDLVSRPEFRGHQVKITIIDPPVAARDDDEWLASLRRMAAGGIRITVPANDSRESIYEETG